MEIYIHIPFCVKKCAYCDFLSAPASPEVRGQYVKRLCEEIVFYGSRFSDAPVETVFIGGGTPTILEGRQIAEILNTLRAHFSVEKDVEITVECNPGTLSDGKAHVLFDVGVNRLSLGLQSANDKELKLLGRIHTYEDFLASYDAARKAGFSNINVDLMSALPCQTVDSWERTLKHVLTLKPEHISAYSLIIEEGTPFYEFYHADDEKRAQGDAPQILPSEEAERAMYKLTGELLSAHGYERYEISNYARAGFACRHNVGYWTRTDYLGLGLGASSLVHNSRFQNTSDLNEYLTEPFSHNHMETLSRKAQMEEFMFLGLRLMRGVARADFEKSFGVSLESVYGDVIARLKRQGLLRAYGGRVSLTELGVDISNAVLAEFLL